MSNYFDYVANCINHQTETQNIEVQNYYNNLIAIKNAKNKFIATGEMSELIRPEIAESWQRSIKILPYETKSLPCMTKPELDKAIMDNYQFYLYGSNIIDSICNTIKIGIYCMTLTDDQANILYINDEQYRGGVHTNTLLLGVNYMEKYSGTNAVALTLLNGKDTAIYGAEHYLETQESRSCFSSIIKSNGTIIGTITISYDINNYNLLLSGLTRLTADLIEEQLITNRYYNLTKHIADFTSDSTIILDNNLTIFKINNNVLKTLNIDEAELKKIGINDFFKDVNFKSLIAEKNQKSFETTLYMNNSSRKVLITAIPIYINNKLDSLILKLSEKYKSNIQNQNYIPNESLSCFNDIITKDEKIIGLIKECKSISKLDIPVLILGESGTGKELFAQSIHNESNRSNEPLVAVNCASIPINLIESELFGFEKGSFTGANTSKPGKFELANKGTIFLDEIGELPLDIQSKLLRVLDNYKVSRIGSAKEKQLDIRIIAATNRNLYDEVLKNRFRLDLYYRLNVLSFTIPPLRDRKGDIALLAQYFLDNLNKKNKKNKIFSQKVAPFLNSYNWIGNIRELQNAVMRAYYLCSKQEIDICDFHINLLEKQYNNTNTDIQSTIPLKKVTKEQELIEKALRDSDGNAKIAAQKVNMSPATLYRKIKKYDISLFEFRISMLD